MQCAAHWIEMERVPSALVKKRLKSNDLDIGPVHLINVVIQITHTCINPAENSRQKLSSIQKNSVSIQTTIDYITHRRI